MSSLTGVTAIDNTLTGLQDLNLDELDVTTVVADTISSTSVSSTSLASTTISLNGTDLQTTLTDLQTQITAGGGYFVLNCEFNGNSTNAGFFGFGAGTNSNQLRVVLPNCSCIGYRGECATAVVGAGNIVFLKNGTAVNALGMAFVAGDTFKQDLARNTSFVLGDYISIRFNNAGSSMVGTAWRATYIFQTNAVNGTNGTNGTDGTNGQNVSFNTPNFINLIPVTTPYVTDSITTTTIGTDTTQTHQLTFGINRGKNSSFVIGTVSSTTGTPVVSLVNNVDGNGDNVYTMNMILPQGQQGDKGDQGNQGEKGDNGSNGSKGDRGDKGEKGDMGLIGLPGIPGVAGAVGAMGPMGPRGFDGDKGDKGDTGEPGAYDYIEEDDITQTVSIVGTNGLNVSYGGLYCESVANFNNNVTIPSTRQLYISNILPSSSSSTINVSAPTINLGAFLTTNLNLESDTITIITHPDGIITFGEVTNSASILINGSQNITNNLTVDNNVYINEDLRAGTDGEPNEHTFYGKLYIQTIEGVDNANPLNIGEDTNELQILSNNIAIGNLDNVVSQVIINNKTISIGETLANTEVNIGNTDSKISCNGSTDTITLDTTNLIIDTTETDINGDITLGNMINANTNVLIQNRNINIGTTQTGMTNPALNMGTTNKTYVEVNSLNCEINSTETLTLYSANNSVLDGSVIDIGHSTSDINIQGSTIDIGTSGVLNTINIGNNYSSVNINTIDSQYITIENFVNQLGF